MPSFNIQKFVDDLKAAGVVVSNEAKLVLRVIEAKDPVGMLCKHFRQGRSLGVSFAVDPSCKTDRLADIFKDNGLTDGWSFREFVDNVKLIED